MAARNASTPLPFALALAAAVSVMGAPAGRAQEPGAADTMAAAAAAGDTAGVAELRRRIDAISRELEELRLGRELVVDADTSVLGFGPAASKVYKVPQGVSIGGYGEMLYENVAEEREDGAASERRDQIDFLRAILYAGYKFNDRILFNSELEFEHATTGRGTGEVSVEFAYLDFLVSDRLGARAGLLLLPMGFLNELHEPPTFLGTMRPETERQIIPSTWRENGAGLFGDAGPFAWRAYIVNGLDGVGGGPSNTGGFSASGLRNGRPSGSRAVAEDLAGVGRLEYVGAPGVRVGGSLYLGSSGQDAELGPGEEIGARTLIWEGHAEVRAKGFDLRGLFAIADVDDVARLNAARELTGSSSIGERLVGWYLQGGYDVLRGMGTEHELIPYVRYERLDTQDAVPSGFERNPANDRSILSLGAAWKPIPNVIVKGDYQVHSNEAETGVDQLNAALGYLF